VKLFVTQFGTVELSVGKSKVVTFHNEQVLLSNDPCALNGAVATGINAMPIVAIMNSPNIAIAHLLTLRLSFAILFFPYMEKEKKYKKITFSFLS
jgi:hypothetical protein